MIYISNLFLCIKYLIIVLLSLPVKNCNIFSFLFVLQNYSLYIDDKSLLFEKSYVPCIARMITLVNE